MVTQGQGFSSLAVKPGGWLVGENVGKERPEPPVLMLPILYASGGIPGEGTKITQPPWLGRVTE
jgi:hypothetical protein